MNIMRFEYNCSTMTDSLQHFEAEIFHALAHPTRIAIVEALRHGEVSAGKLVDTLDLEQANTSQHLSVLRAKMIVANRKVGNQVFYSLRDPVLLEVLDILRRYFCSQLTDTVNMLEEINQAELKGKQRKKTRRVLPPVEALRRSSVRVTRDDPPALTKASATTKTQ